jgi:hypothetical protein
MENQIVITTTINLDGKIAQEGWQTADSRKILARVMDTAEEETEKSLLKLGWRKPAANEHCFVSKAITKVILVFVYLIAAIVIGLYAKAMWLCLIYGWGLI